MRVTSATTCKLHNNFLDSVLGLERHFKLNTVTQLLYYIVMWRHFKNIRIVPWIHKPKSIEMSLFFLNMWLIDYHTIPDSIKKSTQ